MDQSFPTWSFDKPCARMQWTETISIPITIGCANESELENANLIILCVFATSTKDDAEIKESDDAAADVEPMELQGLTKSLDIKLKGGLSDLIHENADTFKNGTKAGIATPTLRVVGESSKRYIVMGLGPSTTKNGETPDWTGYGFALGKAIASKLESEKKISTVNLLLPELIGSNTKIIQDFATAFYENLYVDNRYRTGANIKKMAEDLKQLQLLVEGPEVADPSCIDIAKKLASGVFLAKDIVNAPHNVLNSESLSETARRVCDESSGKLKCIVLGKAECEKRGMGAYLGVARGSETEPQFIHATYTPISGNVTKKVAVIGKGLLFDTGGYNIKTQMMELMKFDCGGSAAVFGAAMAIAELAPENIEVHFVVAACENMINDKAMVPSDILTASNGKTIEVMNTDAEGRLTLADALVYADKELGCDEIIELSTLTGACMVSLGKSLCGVWTNNDDLAKELERASKATGDKSWRMPMAMEYREELNSKVADIMNIGGRFGGAITAALFLQEFVSPKKPFAHIDIAGPVWSDKIGATGFGVKLITEWVINASTK
jgi:leucyl aminopeptidase